MRLPHSLYHAVKHHMAGHQAWHFARIRPIWVDVPQRAELAVARAQFPQLKYLDEVGTGDEFLRFHHEMLREFRWLVLHTPGHSYQLDEWKSLPACLESQFAPGFLPGVLAALPALVAGTSSDALGNFIERTRLDDSAYCDVHNLSHGAIADYEIRRNPGDQRLEDASMTDFAQAPNNEHFWSLHYWIDCLFTTWQSNNGEVVEVSPKPPSHPHGTSFSPSDALKERVRGIFFGKSAKRASID
ncbi:MAG: hypothetical protein KF805_01830 [Phycisphaeraceae bacterium]|nr:hypothetical protein [Phycisphaeraceae bacterium]